MVSTFEIQKNLQNVLAEHPITVKTYLTKDELIIVLNRSRRKPINYENVTRIVETQLIEWQLEGIKKLKIFGRSTHQNYPEWQQVIEINANHLTKKSNRNQIHIPDTAKLIPTFFKTLTSKKVTAQAGNRLYRIKLALLVPGFGTFLYGIWLICNAEMAGFILFLITAVLATGLAVVEALDVLCQEMNRRD